jgi:hypothetical protein
MTAFSSPALAEIRARRATMARPLVYTGARDWFVVPKGFSTDFASVPSFCTWLIPVLGLWTLAAVVHDWLYSVQQVSAVDADGILRRICREEGVPTVLCWLIWTGVRLGAVAERDPDRKVWRRTGWWSTAHLVLPITVASAPLVVPICLLCLLGGLGVRLVEGLTR